METTAPNESSGNYFALPRLIRKLRGRDGTRLEGNWIEAYFTGAAVYLISYLFAASLLWPELQRWQQAMLVLLLLVPGIWIAWLIILYLHSLIVKICWACGLFTDLPRNRVQSVLMGIATTLFAAQLLTAPWLRWIGLLWIIAVALNLAAALLLALFYEEQT